MFPLPNGWNLPLRDGMLFNVMSALVGGDRDFTS